MSEKKSNFFYYGIMQNIFRQIIYEAGRLFKALKEVIGGGLHNFRIDLIYMKLTFFIV